MNFKRLKMNFKVLQFAKRISRCENEFQVAKIEFQGPLVYLPTRVAGRVAGSIVAQFTKYFQKSSKVFCVLIKCEMTKKTKFRVKTFLSFFKPHIQLIKVSKSFLRK